MTIRLFDSTLIREAKEAMEFMANVLESSTEYSIIGKDLDGNILLWNEGARRMYGYEPEEVVGKANSDKLHAPEDVASGKPREIMDAALRDGRWEGVIERIRKDGRRITARVVITPRRNADGEPVGYLLISKEVSNELRFTEGIQKANLLDSAIVGTAQDAVDFIGEQCVLTANNDITERKRAEEAQRASQEQLSSVIGSAMDAIITVDADQRVVLFNAAAEKIFDCSRSEAIGQSLDRFIPERFRNTHHAHIVNFGQTRVTTRSMGSLRAISACRSNGEEFPIEASISQVEVDGRKLFTVIIRDITERRRTEEEIAKKTAELEQHSRLLDLAQVLVRDANDDRIILWNRGAEEFYGWTKEEALGRSSHELLQTVFPVPRESIEADIFNTGHWEGELTHSCRDGRRVTVASHQVLQRNERGEPVAILEANNDITDRKEAERNLAEHALKLSTSEEALRTKNQELQTMSGQLWHAAKLATLGELAASIAHELNNPLATVSLRVDSMMSQTAESDPRHRALSIVGHEVDRMSNLVANLLQFSRRKASQVSTIDIRTEVAGTLELLHSHLTNRNIHVAMDFAPDVQMVHADRQQLRQVFLNLLTNAADAMPTGGSLTIRGFPCNLDQHTSALRLEFADTGVGITDQDLAKVTEPFYTTKPEGKGTGLGLAICKRIVQEHRGEFEIASEAGKGTTVSITLPVSATRDDSDLVGTESIFRANH